MSGYGFRWRVGDGHTSVERRRMSKIRFNAALVATAAFAVGLSACSDDDDPLSGVTDPATTIAALPTTTPTTTAPVTTLPPVTTTLPPTTVTTVPPPTLVTGGTPDDEALAAQVAADYAAGLQRMRVLEAEPTLENLDARVGEFAAPDSPFFTQIRDGVAGLVADGQVIVLNDPPIDTLTVEEVRFRGTAPYTTADVLACEGNNLKEITPAANSPTGSEEVHADEGILALRVWLVLVATPDGWKRYDDNTNFVKAFEGQATCDPA